MTTREAMIQAIKEVDPRLNVEIIFQFATTLMTDEAKKNFAADFEDPVPSGCENEAVAFFKSCLTGVSAHPIWGDVVKKIREEGEAQTLQRSKLN